MSKEISRRKFITDLATSGAKLSATAGLATSRVKLSASAGICGLVINHFKQNAFAKSREEVLSDSAIEQHPAFQFYIQNKRHIDFDRNRVNRPGSKKSDYSKMSFYSLVDGLNELTTLRLEDSIFKFRKELIAKLTNRNTVFWNDSKIYSSFHNPYADPLRPIITRDNDESYNNTHRLALYSNPPYYIILDEHRNPLIPISENQYHERSHRELTIELPPRYMLNPREQEVFPSHNIPGVDNVIRIRDLNANGLQLSKQLISQSVIEFLDEFYFTEEVQNTSCSQPQNARQLKCNLPRNMDKEKLLDEQVRRFIKANLMYKMVIKDLIDFYQRKTPQDIIRESKIYKREFYKR